MTARSDEDLLTAVIDGVIYWLDAYGEIPLSVVVRPTLDGGVVLFLVLARAANAEIFGAVPKATSPHHLRCAPDPAGRWSCAITVDV
jgi:protein archease